jgi:hypothetical protein
MKKILALLVMTLMLAGCAPVSGVNSDGSVKYDTLLNVKRDTETWDGKINPNIYLLGFSKVDSAYKTANPSFPLGKDIVAVRYEITNISDKPISLAGLTLGNAGFSHPQIMLGKVNYNDSSLHYKLGFPSFPKVWNWTLPAGQKVDMSLDWLVEGKDYKLYYWLKMPFDKNYKSFSVSLKP